MTYETKLNKTAAKFKTGDVVTLTCSDIPWSVEGYNESGKVFVVNDHTRDVLRDCFPEGVLKFHPSYEPSKLEREKEHQAARRAEEAKKWEGLAKAAVLIEKMLQDTLDRQPSTPCVDGHAGEAMDNVEFALAG